MVREMFGTYLGGFFGGMLKGFQIVLGNKPLTNLQTNIYNIIKSYKTLCFCLGGLYVRGPIFGGWQMTGPMISYHPPSWGPAQISPWWSGKGGLLNVGAASLQRFARWCGLKREKHFGSLGPPARSWYA